MHFGSSNLLFVVDLILWEIRSAAPPPGVWCVQAGTGSRTVARPVMDL